MKPLVLYHAHCADGFGAAFAAWMKFGDSAEYMPMSYRKDNQLDGIDYKGRDIYILDFSFSKSTMTQLFWNAAQVIWLDHHASVFKDWGVLPNLSQETYVSVDDLDIPAHNIVILDNTRSGALIAWEYFHRDTAVPMLIRHIDDYDRWQFKLDGTKEYNKALWSYTPWSFEQWHNIFDLTDDTTAADMYSEGEAILRAHDQNVTAVVEAGVMPCEIYLRPEVSASGLAVNAPHFLASDVGHELANRSGTYGLVWSLSKNGRANCSLRSNGNYDVSAIAKEFGGGGHKNAGGFDVSMEQLHSWLR